MVTIDGELAETELGLPEGFIVVKVPEGEHVVEVRFGTTPARSVAWMITAVSLIISLVVAWKLPSGGDPKPATPLKSIDKWMLGAVSIVTAVSLFILQPSHILHDNSTGTVAEPAQIDTLF